MRPFLLYHWSPIANRPGILRHGLRTHRPARGVDWRAPYICLSRSPSLAWNLSVARSPFSGEWDLWMVWSNHLAGLKVMVRRYNVEPEYRVFERIRKRLVWHVGTRTFRKRLPGWKA